MDYIDGEALKQIDGPYARQVKVLAKLCQESMSAGFVCNPSSTLIFGKVQLYYMGQYIRDAQMRALDARPLMLSESRDLGQNFVAADKEVQFSEAVLVRLPTEEEERELILTGIVKRDRRPDCLELLRFLKAGEGKVWFAATGIKEFYIGGH